MNYIMKKLVIAITLLAVLLFTSGCAMVESGVKGFESNTKGLNRTVQVYDLNGNVIFEDEGVIRVSENEYGNKVIFQLDGKRYAFYNATVIMIEQ